MKQFSLFFILILFAFVGCNKKQTNPPATAAQDSLEVSSKKTISSIGESLNSNAKRATKNWEEYHLLDDMMTRFYAISNAEALSNSKELSELAKNIKDSIRIKRLQTPAFKARLNLFYSECKRLEDMNNIVAITPDEVTFEIRNILNAFSGVNAKLNSIYAIEKLENELELDPDFKAILEKSEEKETKPEVDTKNVGKTKIKPVEKRTKGREVLPRKIISKKKVLNDGKLQTKR